MVEKSNIPRICDVSFQKAKVASQRKSSQTTLSTLSTKDSNQSVLLSPVWQHVVESTFLYK